MRPTEDVLDGNYRVCTGRGDYFVRVYGNTTRIWAAIGANDDTQWTNRDYANIGRVLNTPSAWLETSLRPETV